MIRLNALDQCNSSFFTFDLCSHTRAMNLDFTGIDY